MLSYEKHFKKMNDVSSRAYIGLLAKLDILMNNINSFNPAISIITGRVQWKMFKVVFF